MSEALHADAMEDYAPGHDEAMEAPEEARFDLMAAIKSPNLAFDLDDTILAEMGSKVVDEYKLDDLSRKEWMDRYDAAMKLAIQTNEVKNTPWPNASNVKYPLISTAAIQFNARAYPAVIDGPEVVKGAVRGQMTPEKAQRAERIGKHMSYQLMEQMDDWEEDTDRLLIQLPIVGCGFRKTWFDPIKGYNCSHLVSAKDFVVNYWTKDLETCPRATHLLQFYPYEVREKMRAGLWLDVELPRSQDDEQDEDAPYTFLEQYRLWDLDGDGYPEPYTVTCEKESGRVVRVVARYDERSILKDNQGRIIRITPTRVFTKYGFIPAPDGSFYDIGFGTLLHPISETINTTFNQLMDAGKLANLQGGFIGDGVSLKAGTQPFRPGEWRKVTVTGQSLRDNIVPLPTKEPSSVLFQLLGLLMETAKDVTATQDILSGDAGKGSLPVGTVTALVEQGLKTFTAIVKRIHRALKKELGILYNLNARYLNDEEYFTFQDQPGVVALQDYAQGDMDVVPVSDPNMATDTQRLQQAQFIMEVGKATGAIPPRKVAEVALKAARVADIDELLGPEPEPQPNPDEIAAKMKAEEMDRRTEMEAYKVAADVEKTQAETEALKLQNMMASPELAMAIEQAVRAAVQQTLSMVENGGQVRPGAVPGMGGEPPNQAVPELPVGTPGDAGGPMGAGPGDGSEGAIGGAPAGGDFLPQMG